ncbi:MAG: hypothetical protein MUP27_00040 [Desulfobacterales bacterium]|nr:hypothetical protein [Desulfobacterales bacterium]
MKVITDTIENRTSRNNYISYFHRENDMEKELKDDLDQNFAKLATKEEVNILRAEMKKEVRGLSAEIKVEVNGLRVEMKDMEDRVLHKYHVTAEALRDDIKQVAEGVINLNEKFDREMS